MNYHVLKSNSAPLLVMGGGLNHGYNFGYLHIMLGCYFLKLFGPLLKILGNGGIEGSLALFPLCRGNLVGGLLGYSEFSPWLGERLDFCRGVPFGPGGAVSQWCDRGGGS